MIKNQVSIRFNRYIFIMSIMMTIAPIFTGKFYRTDRFSHNIGFPIQSVSYFGDKELQYNFQIFFPENFSEVSINAGAMLFSFFFYLAIFKIIKSIYLWKNH